MKMVYLVFLIGFLVCSLPCRLRTKHLAKNKILRDFINQEILSIMAVDYDDLNRIHSHNTYLVQ